MVSGGWRQRRSSNMRSLALALTGMAMVRPACCMKEEMDIEEDYRRLIVLGNFGFYENGQINLMMRDLQVSAVAAAVSAIELTACHTSLRSHRSRWTARRPWCRVTR